MTIKTPRVIKNASKQSPPAPALKELTNKWRSRIVRHDVEAPDQLLANTKNWRIHPRYQQMAMEGALDVLGWVDEVKVNINTGNVVDGHMRVELAISANEATIPVTYLDLTVEEEELMLATFDPLGALAVTDKQKYAALAGLTAAPDRGLQALIDHQAGRQPIQALSETAFLSSFIATPVPAHASPQGAPHAPEMTPDGVIVNPEVRAQVAAEVAALTGTASTLPVIEADERLPTAAIIQAEQTAAGVTPPNFIEYLKIVFTFTAAQKKGVFERLNAIKQERNLETHGEALCVALGVAL